MTTFTIGRRDAIRGVTATFGAASLRGFAIDGEASAYYTHGVASGDPLADRVILWTRVLPSSGLLERLEGRWQVASDDGFQRVVAEGSAIADPQRDNTVKIDAVGLTPDRHYWYRFIFSGVISPPGRTRTLPAGRCDRFSIGVCSCSNYPQGYFNAYRDIAEAPIDVVMHLGDYIYEYAVDGYSNPVVVEELGRGFSRRMKFLPSRITGSATGTIAPIPICRQRMPRTPGFVCGMIMNWQTTRGKPVRKIIMRGRGILRCGLRLLDGCITSGCRSEHRPRPIRGLFIVPSR